MCCDSNDAAYGMQGGYNGYFLRNVTAVKGSWLVGHTEGDGKSKWPHVRLLLTAQTL